MQTVKREFQFYFIDTVAGQALPALRFGHGRQIGPWDDDGSSPSQLAHSSPKKGFARPWGRRAGV
jgi:hypothetical protein